MKKIVSCTIATALAATNLPTMSVEAMNSTTKVDDSVNVNINENINGSTEVIVEDTDKIENNIEEPLSKETLKEKIKMLKSVIKKSYISFDDDITDEFLREFVDYIKVKDDYFEWYLNVFNDKIDSEKERTLLTRLALNKEDVGRYFSLHYKGSYNRVKDVIYIDIYI